MKFSCALFVIQALLLSPSYGSASELKLTFSDQSEKVEIRGTIFIVMQLRYVARDGVLDQASEMYLVGFHEGEYPVIIDQVPGHSVRLELVDLDSDGAEELLVFYHSGGSQLQVVAYRIFNSALLYKKIVAIKNMPLSSNMGFIQALDEGVVVRNQKRLEVNEAEITEERYLLKGDTMEMKSRIENTVTR